MNDNTQPSEKSADRTTTTEALHKKAVAAEKSAERALTDYEAKNAAYDEALKHPTDKATLRELRASAKIAKLTHRIRRIEYKLAKSQWKSAAKADKKATDEKPSKSAKSAPKKTKAETAKPSAAQAKSDASAPSAKAGKKKAAQQSAH
jgi:hypothetical protein